MNDDEGIPLDEKEPWQVVGCPQCKAPPGMRCTGSRMQTHGLRRRAFAARLEKEGFVQDKTSGRGRNQRSDAAPDLDNAQAAPNQQSQPRQSEKSGWGRSRTKDAGATSERDWRSSPKAASSGIKTVAKTPSRTIKASDSPIEAATSWDILAAQLRKDKHLTKAPTAPLPLAGSSLPAPLPSARPLPLPTREPTLAAPKPSSPASTLPATFKHATPDDTQVWRLHACPLCRARPGDRCFGTLGQALFMSHAARIKVHAASTAPQFPATRPPIDKDSHE